MRVYLNVPYEQKDEAKRMGARWDSAKRQWYVIDPPALTPFQKFLDVGVMSFEYMADGKKKRKAR